MYKNVGGIGSEIWKEQSEVSAIETLTGSSLAFLAQETETTAEESYLERADLVGQVSKLNQKFTSILLSNKYEELVDFEDFLENPALDFTNEGFCEDR